MSRNRILLLEVEKSVREANQTIHLYDSRWQDLRELNKAVCAAEADAQAATDTAKPAVKGKKNAVRAGPTQESLDLKHARDSRSRIEWDLAALLRRLHRFRQSVVDWLSCSDLRHQHSELSSLKKILDLRYKRGRAFYSEGRCSDPSNDRGEGLSSDLPSHHCNALIWIDEFLADLRRQRRLFRSEMTRLQSSPISSQLITQTRITSSKSIAETRSQSPPKLSSSVASCRKRRRGKTVQEVKLPVRSESRELERDDSSLERMPSAERNERIGILEGLSHIHRVHIARLATVRNGLLCQTLDAPSELLDQLKEALNPYIHNNSSGSLVVGEEAYEPLSSLPGDTFDQSTSSGSDSSATSISSSSSISSIPSCGSRNDVEEECCSQNLHQSDISVDRRNSVSVCLVRNDESEILEALPERQLDDKIRQQSNDDDNNSQENGSDSTPLASPRSFGKDEERRLEEIHVDNEGLTAASTEAESDISEGSSSCVMSPAPQYFTSEGQRLILDTLFDSDNDNNSIINNSSTNGQASCSLLESRSSSTASWESTPWRYWDGPWLGRPTNAAALNQLMREGLLMELMNESASTMTTWLVSQLIADRERAEATRLLQCQQQQYYCHDDHDYCHHRYHRNIWGPVEQIEWLNRQPVFICQMNVNFDGHRISKHPLSSSHIKKAAEYLNIRSGDRVEVLVRQPGGWAFGICRQLTSNQTATERLGWFPEWLTHRPFCEPIAFGNAPATTPLRSNLHTTLGHVRSPIINVNPASSLLSSLPSSTQHRQRRHRQVLRHFRPSRFDNSNELVHDHNNNSIQSDRDHINQDAPSSPSIDDTNLRSFSSIKSSSFSSRLQHYYHHANNSRQSEQEQLVDAIIDEIIRSSRFSND